MNETQQYIDQLNTDKSNLVTNLVNKGVSATNDETFTTLVPKVAQIEPILQAKSTYASVSDDVVVTASPSYDGLSKVTVHQITSSVIPNLTPDVIKRNEVILDVTGTYGPTSQVKNATPSTKSQVIKPDEGIEFMSAVNLSAVTSSIDPDIQPGNIKKDITILGVEGTYTGDLVLEDLKTVNPVKAGSIVVPSSGYDAMEQVKINPVTASIDSNIQPQNIKKDITILGVEGTYEPEPTQEKTVTPKTNKQVIQPDEGYSGLSKVTVQEVTSDIDSDIKSSNILDGVTILGVTGNVIPLTPDMLEEKTVTPSTSSQILTPSAEKEGFSKVTVYPVTSAIDTNITPDNIKVNKTILGVTGTYTGGDISLQEKTVNPTPSQQEILPDAEYDALSKVTVNAIETEELSVTPTTQQQVYDHSNDTPYSKVTVKAVTSSIDPNIQPENIKRNMSILGVIGTYEGEEQTYFGALSAGSTSQSGIVNSILKLPNDLVITGTSATYLFASCYNLQELPTLDFSNITNIDYCFYNLKSLTSIPNYNFNSVTTAQQAFSYSDLSNVSNFSLSLPNVTNINGIFKSASMPANFSLSFPNTTEIQEMFTSTRFSSQDLNLDFSIIAPKAEEFAGPFSSSVSVSNSITPKILNINAIYGNSDYVDNITITDSSYTILPSSVMSGKLNYTLTFNTAVTLPLNGVSLPYFTSLDNKAVIITSGDIICPANNGFSFLFASGSSMTDYYSDVFDSENELTKGYYINSEDRSVINAQNFEVFHGLSDIYNRIRNVPDNQQGIPLTFTYNVQSAKYLSGILHLSTVTNVIVNTTNALKTLYIGGNFPKGNSADISLQSLSEIDCSGLTNISISFGSDVTAQFSSFTDFGGFKNIGQAYTQKTEHYIFYRIYLSKFTALSHASLMNVINKLYDLNLSYDTAGGGTLYRQYLILGAENYAKLSPEEIAIATNKGWDVVESAS